MAKNEVGDGLSPSARRLVDAAEDLIGIHGVENVSNVHIAKAAGHRNKYAVQYHFGSKEDLIKQVLDDRLYRINERRNRELETICSRTDASIRDYVRALIIPMHDEVDASGLHKYTKFLSRIMDSADAVAIWRASDHSSSALETQRQIRRCASQLSDEEFTLRYELALEVIAGAFRAMDRQWARDPKQGGLRTDVAIEALLNHAIDLTTQLFTIESS